MDRIISVGKTTIVTAVISSMMMACTQGGFRSYRMDLAKYQALQKELHKNDPTIQQEPTPEGDGTLTGDEGNGNGNGNDDDASGTAEGSGEKPAGDADKKAGDEQNQDSGEIEENPTVVPQLLVEIEQGLDGDLTVETLEELFKKQDATNSLIKGMSVDIKPNESESALILDFKIAAEAEKQLTQFNGRVKMALNAKGQDAIMKITETVIETTEVEKSADSTDTGADAGAAAAAAADGAANVTETEKESTLVAGTLICIEDTCDTMIGLMGVKSETGAEKIVFKLTKAGELTGPFKSFAEVESMIVKKDEKTESGTGPTEGEQGSATDAGKPAGEPAKENKETPATPGKEDQEAERKDARTAQAESVAKAKAAKAAAEANKTQTTTATSGAQTAAPASGTNSGVTQQQIDANKAQHAIDNAPAKVVAPGSAMGLPANHGKMPTNSGSSAVNSGVAQQQIDANKASNGKLQQAIDAAPKQMLPANHGQMPTTSVKAAQAQEASKAAATKALADARTQRALRQDEAARVAKLEAEAKVRAQRIADRKAEAEMRARQDAYDRQVIAAKNASKNAIKALAKARTERALNEERQRQHNLLVQQENRNRAAVRAKAKSVADAKLVKAERERRQQEANKRLGIIPAEDEANKTDF